MDNEKRTTEYLTDGLENMPGGVFIYRRSDGQLLYANRLLLDFLGCSDFEEMLAYSKGVFANIIYAEDRQRVSESIQEQCLYDDGSFIHLKYRLRTRQEEVRYVEDFGRKLYTREYGEIFQVFIVDAGRKLLSNEVDELTSLPSQHRLLVHAQIFHQMCEETGVQPVYLYFDLSNFKVYNMNHGAESGNTVLRDVAQVLRQVFPNDYVARSAEDHFLVLTDGFKLIERTKQALDKIDSLYPQANIYSRAGICRLKKPFATPDEGARFAREACESIRRESHTRIQMYSEELAQSLQTKAYVVGHIDEAIRNGWIQVYLHPVISTSSHCLVSCEALARWNDPERGLLPPGDFIGALEQSNQITKLDLYVLEDICRQLKAMKDSGKPFVPISFNLSRMDFFVCDIFSEVEQIREKYSLPPEYLRIEITESILHRDSERIRSIMDRFHGAGYAVLMDDFGSGYSSLNLLKDFEFDELKIDMDFLSEFSEKSKAIIESVVEMARRIGVPTIAEGVETREHYRFLCDIGCDKAQGYLFSSPIPFEGMERLIEEFQHFGEE